MIQSVELPQLTGQHMTYRDRTRRPDDFVPRVAAVEILDVFGLGHLEVGVPDKLAMRLSRIDVRGGSFGVDDQHIEQISGAEDG